MIDFEKYWPTQENMNEVCSLKNIPDAILLAVHQNRFLKVDAYGVKEKVKFTENDFYNDFLNSKKFS